MMQTKIIKIGNYEIANNLPFTLIAGPCQMESRDHVMMVAEQLKNICDKLKINLIFKTSFDKANRSSVSAQRGVGLEAAMPIFAEIKQTFNVPILTDVHSHDQCDELAKVVDVLQIPAFLCRQTDLLLAAAKTGCAVNVKKGQFLAPADVKNIADKLEHGGCNRIMLTERGVSFGYNTLISDMRSLKIMADVTGYPIVFDATHSVQQPGGLGNASGGQREYVALLARAAVAVGVGALFIETHDNPDIAPSDGPCMVPLNDMELLLKQLQLLDNVVKQDISL
jgi:2-dehydro-3-deoxyphosphooctonate aldolase (KDO 8-P synthase)